MYVIAIGCMRLYLSITKPNTMNDVVILREFLTNGLRTLYETESKLAVSVTDIIHSTERRVVKAELLVYLESVCKNMKAIEEMFYFLQWGMASPEPQDGPSSMKPMFATHHTFFQGRPTEDLLASLQRVIQCKKFLYENVYGIAVKLEKPEIAFSLLSILEFENDTETILKDVMENSIPFTFRSDSLCLGNPH